MDRWTPEARERLIPALRAVCERKAGQPVPYGTDHINEAVCFLLLNRDLSERIYEDFRRYGVEFPGET